jgi:hypothetical protein
MKKISKFPKNKKQFHRCHVKMWGFIYTLGESKIIKFNDVYDVKDFVFEKCFSFDKGVAARCFPCHWRIEKAGYLDCNKSCLLITKNKDSSEEDCLNGNFQLFIDAIENRNGKDAIKYAKIIRDFPLRK